MKISKSRLLYGILNFIIYFFGFLLGMIVTASVMLILTAVGMAIEYYYHIDVFNWIVVIIVFMVVALMICIFIKDYLKCHKNINTYSVGYYDVAEKEIKINEYSKLSEAEEAALMQRKQDGIATIVIIKHMRNKYTNQNSSKLIITYENVNTINEFKKPIVDRDRGRTND